MNVKKVFNQANWRGMVLASAFLVLLVLAWLQVEPKPAGAWQKDKVEVGIRMLGHKLMAHHGDSSSPIPPVLNLDNNTLRLSLPQSIALDPDRLSAMALEIFDDSHFRKAILQVYTDQSGEMVYGFGIDPGNQGEVPCLGRVLPPDHYHIDLKVKDKYQKAQGIQLAMMGMAGFGLMILLVFGLKTAPKKGASPGLTVGGVSLDRSNNRLYYQGTSTELTKREMSLALILMEHPGELVSRDYLIEQVWSKEGVVTGRSLDVFISRLRKKFAINPQLEIVNKHGQGYMLRVKQAELRTDRLT